MTYGRAIACFGFPLPLPAIWAINCVTPGELAEMRIDAKRRWLEEGTRYEDSVADQVALVRQRFEEWQRRPA